MHIRKLASFGGAMVLVLACGAATATPPTERSALRQLPASIESLRLDGPLAVSGIDAGRLDASLLAAEGETRVIIRLSNPSVARQGVRDNAAVHARDTLRIEQSAFLERVRALDPEARVIASVQIVLNAVFVEVDAAVLPQLAKDPAVARIAPVADYELDLAETVPYIGAAELQSSGYTGRGIKVAVLDSGIDYTHAAFSGPGTVEFYQQCFDLRDVAPQGKCAKYFGPGAPKVVGGYDFVGELWPNGDLAPDPNPIDFQGHGTNVADIAAGKNGVAPGASLYAVKVCSAISSSCSGIALIQGMEFSVNPSGDGRLNDRVDVINMSLGASYGRPFDQELSTAVDAASDLGILTVASAGNSGDKPYVTGTPSSAWSALSVAQTAVPSGTLPQIEIVGPAGIAGIFPAAFQTWSQPVTARLQAPVQFADGAGGNALGCAPFEPGSLAGKIVLVDRGGCNFTLKAANISEGGALAGIIGLVTPDQPFAGADGGDRPIDVPVFMISQTASNRLKAGLPDTAVAFDPALDISLAQSIVSTSSRGPQHDAAHLIKPEIGAPGASVSALAGSGDGTRTFGGTSGAAPMVAGSAALLLEAFGGTKTTAKGTPRGRAVGHGLRPVELKARLMNNGETDIVSDPLTGALAPITRIGGGEVRVDRALAAPIAAWDDDHPQGGLSFGFVDVTDSVTLTRTVRVRNYSNTRRTYTITPTFRFADDAASGAVSVSAPQRVTVGPGRGTDTLFDISITIDGSRLPGNFMNSGSQGANADALTANEIDGYLVLDDGKHPIHMPWHVLPRKAAQVVPATTDIIPGSFPQAIGLTNTGIGTAQNDAYALIATSPRQVPGGRGEQRPTPDIRAVGINTFRVPANICSANPSFVWAFAVNTWEPQQHLLPVSHLIYLDTDRDGTDDYVVLNRDLSGLGSISDGRQLSWVVNLATGSANAFFFAEHSMNTGNTVLLLCGEQIGMNAADLLSTQVNVDVIAQDFYFGGPGDIVSGLTVTPLGERFFGATDDLPAGFSGNLDVYDFGAFPGNSPELGLMLITNGDRGAGNRGGATKETEALLFGVPQ